MKFTDFGNRFLSDSGIGVLMEDLGRAMAGRDDILMLGGGNPAHIPGVQKVWRRRMAELLGDGDAYERMLTNYDTARGDPRFVDALAEFMNRQFGWGIGPGNIAVMNGGQTAFFCLINLLAGRAGDGPPRKILFPLMPEYIGYADQSLSPDTYRAARPVIDLQEPHMFKYRVDFDRLEVPDEVGAICASRPTNPTGNVLTDEEVGRLREIAARHDVPLIIDNAYGLPFPGVIFVDAQPSWDPNTILTLSLSKLGLPGTRTGIVIAPEEITRALVAMNSIVSLASGSVGQAIVAPLLEDDSILGICRDIIQPYYLRKSQEALAWAEEYFDDGLDYHIHKVEGALFLWLWLRDLPITTQELYERLKKRGVLVVPGSYFFFGLDSPWRHADECIRINFSQGEDVVREGIRIIADEAARAYAQT